MSPNAQSSGLIAGLVLGVAGVLVVAWSRIGDGPQEVTWVALALYVVGGALLVHFAFRAVDDLPPPPTEREPVAVTRFDMVDGQGDRGRVEVIPVMGRTLGLLTVLILASALVSAPAGRVVASVVIATPLFVSTCGLYRVRRDSLRRIREGRERMLGGPYGRG